MSEGDSPKEMLEIICREECNVVVNQEWGGAKGPEGRSVDDYLCWWLGEEGNKLGGSGSSGNEIKHNTLIKL